MSTNAWEFVDSTVQFNKRPLEDIIADSTKIKPEVIAAEILTWLITNVENYVDSSSKVFKLDLILDDSSNMPQTQILQDLYRAIPDDEGKSEAEIGKATECRRMLDKITEEAYNYITKADQVLEKLFQRIIFYYERIIPSPENRKRALEIDEELKVLLKTKESLNTQEEKDKIQAQIVEKVKEGKALVQFEELIGTVNISKLEYEAFSLGIKLKKKVEKENLDDIIEEQEDENVLKSYVIPEGFTVWLELNYKQKLRPTGVF